MPLDRATAGRQADGEALPEELVMRAESIACLRAALVGLEPRKRELLALRFGSGLKAREIAAIVGKKPAAVQKELQRIVQVIRERYDDPTL